MSNKHFDTCRPARTCDPDPEAILQYIKEMNTTPTLKVYIILENTWYDFGFAMEHGKAFLSKEKALKFMNEYEGRKMWEVDLTE